MRKITFLTLFIGALCACQDRHHSTQIPKVDVKSGNLVNQPGQRLKEVSSMFMFDIPSLLKLPITTIKNELGKPDAEQQANVTDTERSIIYRKPGLELTIDYIVSTGQVDVIAFADKRDTSDYMHLVQMGNLNKQDTTYIIDPQQGEKIGQYHGILIKPNPPVEFPIEP